MYPNQPIGKPVLGNEKTINTFDKQIIRQFMERMYRPERIVISIAGNYDEWTRLTYRSTIWFI